jgi:hypothetical protein
MSAFFSYHLCSCQLFAPITFVLLSSLFSCHLRSPVTFVLCYRSPKTTIMVGRRYGGLQSTGTRRWVKLLLEKGAELESKDSLFG